MNELKKNDFFAALVKNKDLSITDLRDNGITPENSALLSKNDYKSMPQVQEAFKDDNGKFDEAATLAKCPIATEKVEGTDKSEGYVNDDHVFSFSVSMNFAPEIFSQSSHNVLFYSPSRRNVSDSYRAIEDFFTTSLEDSKNGGSK